MSLNRLKIIGDEIHYNGEAVATVTAKTSSNRDNFENALIAVHEQGCDSTYKEGYAAGKSDGYSSGYDDGKDSA